MTTNELSSLEYLPFYGTYIKKAGTKDLISGLEHGLIDSIDLFETIPEDKLGYQYAEDKWTIKDIIQHLLDAERIFTYRILRIARRDKTPLSGFNENDYAKETLANQRSRADLIEAYKAVRQSTISLVKGLNNNMLKSLGNVTNGVMSARAFGFIIIGHEKHHCDVIREKYL